jgi:putative intracellular protease/amidase
MKVKPETVSSSTRTQNQHEASSSANEAGRVADPTKSAWSAKAGASTRPSGVDSAHASLQAKVKALHEAFDTSNAAQIMEHLVGNDAPTNAALTNAYRAQYGRDLEYDLRGFNIDPDITIDRSGPKLSLRGGLRGEQLNQALEALHGPRVTQNAQRLAELTPKSPLTEKQRGEVYQFLQRAGGDERTMLDKKFKAITGQSLVDGLRPIFAQAVNANNARPLTSPPERTVAIVVSSGNWKKMLDGKDDSAKGGYHYREIEAYVREAIEKGFTPVFFTPDGLPPSPDAASLMQGKLGPKLGFGLRKGTGPDDSPQGKAIMDGLLHPRSLASFDATQFATMHVAGGHGSHHDLVGNAQLEKAALDLNAAGKPVSAVCHASPSLGKLLSGHAATGFSPTIDAVMVKAGFVLPEFHPPYDAHQGLREVGAQVNSVASLVNIHQTERFETNGAPVITGTGPEATDNVARQIFEALLA